LIAGLQIIQIIQLFNWFSKKRLMTVIGLWYLVQQIGFFARFEIDNPCGFFDLTQFPYLAGSLKPAGKDGWLYASVGVAFFFVAIFDAYSWVYHPFQRNILVDVEDKDEEEIMKLKALAHNDSLLGNSSLHLSESVINIYDMIQQSVNSKQGNSFKRAFEIPLVLKLLLCGVIFQTAVYMIYYLDLIDLTTDTHALPHT
jgi:hypothetical protein